MHDLFVQLLKETRSAWRFRWYGIALAWVFCLGGWYWVAGQPNIYQATATVFVDTSSVLRPFLGDRIVTLDFATQLLFVRERLLGREHLERVVAENRLDVNAMTDADRERVINSLRQSIQIQNSQPPGTRPRDVAENSLYNISYRSTNRQTAVAVVNTLLNSLVENTLGANIQGTDTAERFVDARILEYEQRLQQAEQALANFRRVNADRLPGTAGGYFQRMQLARDELEAARRELRTAEARRDGFRDQLRGDAPVLPLAFAGPGNYSALSPANELDMRIEQYRAELDRLLIAYTERHPDVTAIRGVLERLEAQRAEAQLSGGSPLSPGVMSPEVSPVYQSLQIRLNEAEAEVASRRADVEEREAALRVLEAMVDDVPQVEAELARLNRDYDVIHDQFQALVQSRETQLLSRLALDADQVEFNVINPPMAGFTPVAPPRLYLMTAVFFVALGGGGGLCYLLAQLRPVFGDPRTLREVTGLPVFGVVREVMTGASARAQRRLKAASFTFALAALVLLFVGAITLEASGRGIHTIF